MPTLSTQGATRNKLQLRVIALAMSLCLAAAACADNEASLPDVPPDGNGSDLDVSESDTFPSDSMAPSTLPCGPTIGRECTDGSVCVYHSTLGCQENIEGGTCQQVPVLCDDVPDNPVLTCGGREYRNECEARKDRYYSWLDPADPEVNCGTDMPDACADDELCLQTSISTCRSDYYGTCAERPESCPAAEPSERVLTCGALHYGSECEARLDGYGRHIEADPEQ